MSHGRRYAGIRSTAVRGVLLMLATAASLVVFLALVVVIGMRRVAREQAESRALRYQHSAVAVGGTPTPSSTQPSTRPAEGTALPSARVSEPPASPLVAGNGGDRAKPPPVQPAPAASKATASLVAVDDTSQGGWVGRYGMQGYTVAMTDVAPHFPVGVDAPMIPSRLYVWSSVTTDPRGLSIPSTPAQLSAAQWFSWDRISLDLDLRRANKSYQVGLYLLDWDSDARVQRLEVIDAASGAVLLSRTDDHFQRGRYVILRLSGHVVLRITGIAGANCTLSGVFFDNPLPAQ